MENGRLGRNALSMAVSLALVGATHAATITVNDGAGCSLAQAITAANNDGAAGNCTPGDGADTIVLPNSAYYPSLPLPTIRSDLTIRGGGSSDVGCEGGGQPFVIGDATSAPEVHLSSFGIISCSHNGGVGTTGGGGAAGMGGSIFVYDGIVSLQRISASRCVV